MGCETNLPSMVLIYLELVEKLFELLSQEDSRSLGAEQIQIEIRYFLNLIREEMQKLANEENPTEREGE